MATTPFRKGTEVKWQWGANEARGTVVETFTRRVQRTFKGTKVVRNADEDNPAYVVEQDDGDRALKSHSELERA